jgi:hypothetical protein
MKRREDGGGCESSFVSAGQVAKVRKKHTNTGSTSKRLICYFVSSAKRCTLCIYLF